MAQQRLTLRLVKAPTPTQQSQTDDKYALYQDKIFEGWTCYIDHNVDNRELYSDTTVVETDELQNDPETWKGLRSIGPIARLPRLFKFFAPVGTCHYWRAIDFFCLREMRAIPDDIREMLLRNNTKMALVIGAHCLDLFYYMAAQSAYLNSQRRKELCVPPPLRYPPTHASRSLVREPETVPTSNIPMPPFPTSYIPAPISDYYSSDSDSSGSDPDGPDPDYDSDPRFTDDHEEYMAMLASDAEYLAAQVHG